MFCLEERRFISAEVVLSSGDLIRALFSFRIYSTMDDNSKFMLRMPVSFGEGVNTIFMALLQGRLRSVAFMV